MGTKSKMFRVFVAGQTISDGRTITPEMVNQCVETFNLETYTPRINIEHISGYSPEPPFNGYGDVVAVEARDVELEIAGKAEKRRALYAQVDANDQLVTLAKKDQKPFPSVELTPSYAGTDKIGLIGLAFTDKPASVGTERLKFSSRAPGSLFSHGADAVEIEFDAKAPDAATMAESIKSGLASFFAQFKPEGEKPKPPVEQDGGTGKPANDNIDLAGFSVAFGEQVGKQIAEAVKPANEGLASLQRDFAALRSQLEKTEQPATFSRAPATGGNGGLLTDC
ncbi:GPO family capsid scaffolding protein [Sphingomonas sp. CBMAI 2297]|uniref:GPO family capsid scaffolding protein n=1 Tax=Sphingomonas sp. CBMAI 2297 TaxID=2991720 RepID=UPI00245568B3|nr:GPO family capsid scaffolding protein [Sphingomonas sp. CBMAI 2297]MDH4743167.1 GPO family capsid scaffolding protein [Sphingomonas sp. CBMAI 2297]